MGPGCKNTCHLRQCNGPLDEDLRKQMFKEFYREWASEISQVRIIITYLFKCVSKFILDAACFKSVNISGNIC